MIFQVECLEFSGDGTLLATGGRDNKIVLSTIAINEDELHKYSRAEKAFAPKEQGIKRNNRGIIYFALEFVWLKGELHDEEM